MAFIRPNLEHATAVWNRHLSKDIQKLVSVQCFACSLCTKSWDDAYCDMLWPWTYPLLSERRKLLKICHLYKVVHGFIDFPNAHYCTNPALFQKMYSSSHTPTTSDSHKLFLFFLLSHAVAIWNSLPFSIVSLPNINKALLNITYLYNLGILYY